MQFVIAALIGALAQSMGSLVGRVLIALGIGYVTFTGLTSLSDWMIAYMKARTGALPADVAAFIAWMNIDKALSMIFSAWVAALAIKTAGSTSLTSMVIKK